MAIKIIFSILSLLTITYMHKSNAECTSGRLHVDGEFGNWEVTDDYFILEDQTCGGKVVYKTETLRVDKFLYWDVTDSYWTIGPRVCWERDSDEYIKANVGVLVNFPDEVGEYNWREQHGETGVDLWNPYFMVQCLDDPNPKQSDVACATNEFLISGVNDDAELDVEGHYIVDTGSACSGTDNRPVYKRVDESNERYMWYDPTEPAKWMVGKDRCKKDDVRKGYLMMYSTATKWEDMQAVWEEQNKKGDLHHVGNKNIVLFCLPSTCHEWSPWVVTRGTCVTACGGTLTQCYSPCGGCGVAESTRTCTVGTKANNIKGSTEGPQPMACNTGVVCDLTDDSQKYEYVRTRTNLPHIWEATYQLRKCCYSPTGGRLASPKPCANVYG